MRLGKGETARRERVMKTCRLHEKCYVPSWLVDDGKDDWGIACFANYT